VLAAQNLCYCYEAGRYGSVVGEELLADSKEKLGGDVVADSGERVVEPYLGRFAAFRMMLVIEKTNAC